MIRIIPKVLYGGKELFAYSSYYRSEILEYRNLEKDESRFAVLEYEVQLKDNLRNDSNDCELYSEKLEYINPIL